MATSTVLTMLAALLLLVAVAAVADVLNGADPGDGDVVRVVR